MLLSENKFLSVKKQSILNKYFLFLRRNIFVSNKLNLFIFNLKC